MLQHTLHYFLHFGLPLFIALIFFKKEWKKIYVIFILTMLIDLDHLLANPIFESNRCSINFHPLHTFYAFLIYLGLMLLKKPFNIIGLGLTCHMLTDFIDCIFIYSNCNDCIINNHTIELIYFLNNILT